MILWLLGCSMAPYGEYWPDKTAYPIVGGVEPGSEGAGGQTVTIRGASCPTRRLSSLADATQKW